MSIELIASMARSLIPRRVDPWVLSGIICSFVNHMINALSIIVVIMENFSSSSMIQMVVVVNNT